MDTQFQHATAAEPTPPPHDFPAFGKPKKRNSKRLMLIVAAIVVALVIGGAAYWFFVMREDKKQTSAPKTSTQQTETPKDTTPKMPEAQASVLQTYKSTKMNLEFSYRKDWTMKESADKSQITLTSPSTTYEATDGSKQGPFTLKIRVGVPASMKETVNKLMAVKDSEVIAYTNPTPEQRYYTNLSYGGQTQDFSLLIVTGSTAFKTGTAFNSAISLSDGTYLFAGGFGEDASDSLVFDAVPITAFDVDVYDQAVDIVKSVRIF